MIDTHPQQKAHANFDGKLSVFREIPWQKFGSKFLLKSFTRCGLYIILVAEKVFILRNRSPTCPSLIHPQILQEILIPLLPPCHLYL